MMLIIAVFLVGVGMGIIFTLTLGALYSAKQADNQLFKRSHGKYDGD